VQHIYHKKGWETLVLDLFSIIIPAVFARIAGTLPLKDVLPSMNVAGPNDVSVIKLVFFVLTKSFRFRQATYLALKIMLTFGAGVPSLSLNQS